MRHNLFQGWRVNISFVFYVISSVIKYRTFVFVSSLCQYLRMRELDHLVKYYTTFWNISINIYTVDCLSFLISIRYLMHAQVAWWGWEMIRTLHKIVIFLPRSDEQPARNVVFNGKLILKTLRLTYYRGIPSSSKDILRCVQTHVDCIIRTIRIISKFFGRH